MIRNVQITSLDQQSVDLNAQRPVVTSFFVTRNHGAALQTEIEN